MPPSTYSHLTGQHISPNSIVSVSDHTYNYICYHINPTLNMKSSVVISEHISAKFYYPIRSLKLNTKTCMIVSGNCIGGEKKNQKYCSGKLVLHLDA